MTIHYAILGMLSYQPMTGYDLKKKMQDSTFMHWSGNNNQIYKALVELLEDGLATNEVIQQESLPTKKIYTITKKGLEELKRWVSSEPEPVEFKKSFLIQLAWADLLDEEQLRDLLAKYENEISLQLMMTREKLRRGNSFVARTGKEAFLWMAIEKNIMSSYQNELDWIRNICEQMKTQKREVAEEMVYRIAENEKQKYLEVFSTETPIKNEQDALELVALCGEKDVRFLMIHHEALSEDFFRLKTGVAGAVLQKFVNYSLATAIIYPELSGLGVRVKELVSEAGKGNQYRFFDNTDEAKKWFSKLG